MTSRKSSKIIRSAQTDVQSEVESLGSKSTRSQSLRRRGLSWINLGTSRFSLRDLNDYDEDDDTDGRVSVGSIISDFSLERIYGGSLIFQSARDEDLYQNYVMLDKDVSMEVVGKFMIKIWKLRTPEIVLTVIANCDYFDAGTESDVEDFQIGLIQAARLTKMWILTEGIDSGVPRIIGEAVAQERVRRKIIEKDLSHGFEDEMTVIGVVACDDLWYGESLEKSTQPVFRYGKITIENKGDNSHELNSQHTHFLLLKTLDQADKDVKWNMRFLIESKLIQNVTGKRTKQGSVDEETKIKYQSPIVGLLVQGGPKEIERTLWLLRKQIPVIIIKRKGYASGLLAYAYSEGLKGGDSQHLENIVKPQLMQQVMEAFPDYCQDNEVGRMSCRDKILECVKHAVQGECRYITVLDPSLRGVDQKDLNKFILSAIFNAQRDVYRTNVRENLNKYLRLTLDWNSPEFARREIVPKMETKTFVVKEELFLEALLQPQREQFVELFLNMGFLLRRFLLGTRLLYLYEESLDNEFFVNVCLERILHRSTHSLGKHFLDDTNCYLNKILFALTGLRQLVNPTRIALASLVTKQDEKETAEREALLALIYWAVLTHRQALAKVLWKRTSEPIAVALVISNMYYHMSHNWILDLDLKKSVKKAAIDFGTLAVEMMDLVFNDSSLMAYYSLVNPLSDFNNLNVIDIALIGNNIFFIAHPCCQRSMRARWLKRIKIKSFSWGFVNVPEYAKIYLCLFLVFPMYFWLTFTPEKRKTVYIEEDDHDDDTDVNDRSPHQEYIRHSRRYGSDDPYLSPPLWRKIYYLWTAPISKFCVYQLSLFAYMVLYALALMIPYCGNKYLNLILFVWTAIKFIEHSRAAVVVKLKYPTFDLTWSILGILADTYICAVCGVQLSEQFQFTQGLFAQYHIHYTTFKFLMSLGIVWVYFRSLRYILPVSQDLGPMLVNITQLTRKDLINWFQLWLVCLVSGGLAINAVVYPTQPFSTGNVLRAQLRALLGVFLTEIEDLKGDSSCSPLYDIPEVSYTCNVSSIQPYIRHRLENCPYVSLPGYLLVIQQLLLTRHVFYTLMFAMFSVTTNRTKERSVEIWKFQFYLMVTDFERRSILPAPFTPITYPFIIGFWGAKSLFFCILNYKFCWKWRIRFQGKVIEHFGIPYHQWNYYMAAMTKKEEEKESHIQDILGQLEEDNAAHEVMVKRVNERLVNIERNQILAGFLLESILNRMRDPDPKSTAQRGLIRPVHTASRSSPYPGTTIARVPVLEKDVSWDVQFESYDPSTYTKPVEEFPPDVQMWIDRDILKLSVQLEEQAPMSGDDLSTLYYYVSLPDPVFNTVQTFKLANEKEATINRISTLRVGDSFLQYEVDSTGVPRNPMGRTGLRGRGNLWRWGPNHVVHAVISRWSSDQLHQTSSDTKVQSSSSKKMEILVVRDSSDPNIISLPAGRVQSIMSTYSALCSSVAKDVLQEADVDMGTEFDQEEMIEFFSKFATPDMRKKKKSMYTTLGYSAFMVYKGYGDDPANTDNAWKESEIWNFHYKYKDCFDNLIKDSETITWMQVSFNIPLPPSEYIAVMEAVKIH